MDSSKTKIDIKIKLAEKYERLARLAGSVPKTAQFSYRAARYRRQAEQLARENN